ncbi:hypothetical protein EFZ62_01265 [Serratia marcescens]|jgi:Predicted membrane protein|nr:hypothetical protein B0W01_24930 [Serratia marcescens]PJI68863.1 hypothetical protein CUN64_10755 [Serratia sp. TKO39]QHC43670.1 hypothetical protein EFZ62_01265 [Serratia marcescens]RNW11456.1 hypothetical protein CAG37_008545 [Serratia nematodiphila]BEO21646.1 hypothetical protein SMQC20_02300 [Serratia marcescens]
MCVVIPVPQFGKLIVYLGMKWWGLFYLLFCWTGIPAIVGFIEGIIYLFQSEEKFNQKYNPGLI